jgi:hypothetical protein
MDHSYQHNKARKEDTKKKKKPTKIGIGTCCSHELFQTMFLIS